MTWYRRRPARVTVDGQALLVALSAPGRAVRLEGAALDVWDALEYPTTLDAVVARLLVEYDAPRTVVLADTGALVGSFVASAIVEEVDEPSPVDVERHRYLWLLKRALADTLYLENELRLDAALSASLPADRLDRQRRLRDIRRHEPERFAGLRHAKRTGALWQGRAPRLCHTTIGLSGLDNIERCAEAIFREGIPGDFLEAGVLAGGATIFMRALQRAHGEAGRRVWLADSFQGLPPSQSAPDLSAGLELSEPHAPWICRDLDTVRDTVARYDQLDDGIRFLAGWFTETLPSTATGPLAMLRIDADLYQSTLDVLTALYDRVPPGGFVIVDDYGLFPPCRQAVDEFRSSRGIDQPLESVDQFRVYWRSG